VFKYGGLLIVPRKCQYEGQVHYKIGGKFKRQNHQTSWKKGQGVNKKGQGTAPF
jgi:hypothetical protein